MSEPIMITGAERIAMVRYLAIWGRLKLEMRGIRFKGRPLLTIMRESGLIQASTRTKRAAYFDLENYIMEHGGPADSNPPEWVTQCYDPYGGDKHRYYEEN
jgi:hypothetical protein